MKKEVNNNPSKAKILKGWITRCVYVDMETAERLTETDAKANYYTIQKKKYVQLNKSRTGGIIEYTHECRRKPRQTTIF